MAVYFICMMIITYIYGVSGVTYSYMCYVPCLSLLIVGIWREKRRLMLPFIVLMVSSVVFHKK
jgi:hypothetical protein